MGKSKMGITLHPKEIWVMSEEDPVTNQTQLRTRRRPLLIRDTAQGMTRKRTPLLQISALRITHSQGKIKT